MMTPEQWARVDSLFHEATRIAEGERLAWLARAAGGDEVVRRELESLLAQEASRTGPLDGHALDQLTREGVPDSLVGERLGGYEFLSLIDEGGMGQVYRARDLTLPRDVAVKVVSPAFAHDPVRRARFRREAELLSAFAHPHIAHIYAFVEAGNRYLLAMELVPGESLADRLSRGPLRVPDAVRLASQIADAVDAAHEQGVIHRDLKPANIRITPDGVVKVLDFGLATTVRPALAGADSVHTRSTPGTLLGTVGYMSPEQARGEDVDKRTDIWAFGCVLFEMLAGRKAFPGATATDTIAAILDQEPDWAALPATVPASVMALLRRCLDKDRRGRLRDIGEARIVCERATQEPAVVSPVRVPTRRRWVWPAAAATVLAAVAVSSLSYERFATSVEQPRLEFPMLPPPGVIWGELPPEPVPRVSPDGRHIVFGARSLDVKGQRSFGLWVRDLDDKNARRLEGSSDYRGNVQAPFWSPDSRTVAYCGGTAGAPVIRKLSVDGRSASQINVSCTGDGSWNAAGQILFRGVNGLFVVNENGDGLKQVTSYMEETGDDHRHPRFLSDGRRFLFTQRSRSPQKAGIYLGSFDGMTPRRLFADVSLAEYVELPGGGCIFFVRVADLIAQRVDAQLNAVGAPVVVARRMRISNSRLPSFSVTASVLAYRNNVGDSALVWMDRRGVPTGVRYGGDTALGSPALSHDGRTVAFSRWNYDTNLGEVWKADVANGIPQKLYATSTIVSAPVFSPDDRQLAFSAADTLIMNLETGKTTNGSPFRASAACRPPARCGETSYPTDWTNDDVIVDGNNSVAWFRFGQESKPTLFANGLHGRVSPDGNWIAYTSSETDRPEVYVQHFPDGGNKAPISQGGGFQPYWREDGREIFYRTDAGEIIAVQVRLGTRVEVIHAERLFKERLQGDGNDFSRRDFIAAANGQRFLVNIPTVDLPPLIVEPNWVQRIFPR